MKNLGRMQGGIRKEMQELLQYEIPSQSGAFYYQIEITENSWNIQ